MHSTPTSSPWLDLVERWSEELAEPRLQRGAFTSAPALVDAIELWAECWNDAPKPFVWHRAAGEIIERARRGGAVPR